MSYAYISSNAGTPIAMILIHTSEVSSDLSNFNPSRNVSLHWILDYPSLFTTHWFVW